MPRHVRTPEEIERRHKELGLSEHELALIGKHVYLVITIALAITTMLCALRGYSWPVSASTGVFGLGAAGAATFDRWRPD
jgi:hypothetical protein